MWNALLFLAMLAALVAGCFWFVLTLPTQEPTYGASAAPGPRLWPEREHQGDQKGHERAETA